ncbi:MAG TPA: DUF58 domain-containing protein [Polyangia bacterium]|nr:DUF58 domain-containing protein [Polyangia bacterium]
MNNPRPRRRTGRRFSRGLSFTREGRVYVVVTLGVGFAAVNTGNNLLFLVLGLMLGLILVSGVLSELSLRGVRALRRLPERVEANVAFPVELELENLKRRAASYSMELRDTIDGEPFKRRCFFLRVEPEGRRAIAYRCERSCRGRSSFDGIEVSTRFPFGLFEKRRFVALIDTVIVHPGRIEATIPVAALAPGEGRRSAGRRGAGQDFLELREMHAGDDPRRIDWRGTARLGRLLVREHEAEARGFVEIVLDAAPADDRPESREDAERAISIAATLARDLAARGLDVRLVTGAGGAVETAGTVDLVALLDHLALLDIDELRQSPAPAGRFRRAVLIGPRAATHGGEGIRPHAAPAEAAGA